MEQEHPNLESFLSWAAQLGISDSTTRTNQPQHSLSSCLGSSLSVSHFPHTGGRGLGAVRDLRRGEIVLRVPKSALMTRETVMEDKKLCDAVNRHSSLSSAQILIVCLLYEMGKGKTSRWHPYLMHLPHTYDVDEAMWVTEKAMLKAKSEWKEAHSLMQDLMFKPQFFTFKAWVWAAATISSRTLHIPWDEAGCLCPVGDLFNYDAPGIEPSGIEDLDRLLSNTSIPDTIVLNGDKNIMVDAEQLDSHSWRLTDGGFEEDANAYCFYAREHYKKGDQVLLCYGTYTNLELLEHYGFLLQENPNDKVFIPLEPALYSSTSWSKESLYIHHNGKPSFALLAALRLWATPQSRRRSVGHLVYSGSRVSTDNEIFIMKWLSKTCDAVLRNLPTSLEEDTFLLNAMDNSQDFSTFMEITKLVSSRDETCTFLETHNMKDTHSFTDVILSRKARRSMDRWKLAVQWRLKYKKVIFDCITYCNKILDSLLK
ncbi:protein SET DOMAIN GROUP 40 isoform X2 [Glycine soja]|uniref:Protein SET DOMAIN GROUP 40 isoform C n=1 Tax=Glycine soja TaxID=3848 RepID=A0A445H8N0_GLYSO|nr:protein SET DOMAIN GROUP 40 isoform X2 [Glycine soja]RZB70044.1 Protein SET DOMAIN GROUP 40 isoform C [Glycine soja]